MRRRSLVLLVLLPLLTGCWSILPIEELSLVGLITVDRDAHGFHVTLETPPQTSDVSSGSASSGGSGQGEGAGGAGGAGGGQPSAPNVLSATAPSFAEAVERIQEDAQGKVWFGITQTVTFTERAARNGAVAEVLDLLDRDPHARNIVWLFVTPNDQMAVIRTKAAQAEAMPGRLLARQALLAELQNPVKPVRLYEFLRDEGDPARASYMPVIVVRQGHYRFAAEALFLRGRFIGALPAPANQGLPWLLAVPTALIRRPVLVNPPLVVDYRDIDRSFRPLYDAAGRLTGFDVRLKATATIIEASSNLAADFSNPRTAAWVAHLAAQQAVRDASATLEAAQRLKADPFGFGATIRATNPALWSAIGKSWHDKVFPHLTFHVSAEIRHVMPGLLSRPVLSS